MIYTFVMIICRKFSLKLSLFIKFVFFVINKNKNNIIIESKRIFPYVFVTTYIFFFFKQNFIKLYAYR